MIPVGVGLVLQTIHRLHNWLSQSPYDLCVGVPISLLLTVRGLMPIWHSVLNVKALVGDFNQEKALVGLLRDCENIADGSFAALV